MRSAAVCSAARWASGSAFSASCSSCCVRSNAAMLGAPPGSRSNLLVYSSTAASPRAFTSARIVATADSIASSVSDSKASSVVSCFWKSGAVESSLRTVMFMLLTLKPGGAFERLDDRLQALALELERGLVDHQARRDVHDLLDFDQVVGAQRAAGRDHVHDRIRQADQRRQLHRAVQFNEVDVHALVGEVFARG